MSVPDPYLIFLNVASIFTAYSFFIEKKKLLALALRNYHGIGNISKRTRCYCFAWRGDVDLVDLGKKIERNFIMENFNGRNNYARRCASLVFVSTSRNKW